MKIAIIGAGLAGLAVAYFLSEKGEVTLFDAKGIGGGASGMAAGLLHPFAGQSGKLCRFGWEGLLATVALLNEVYPQKKGGILRLPFNERMREGLASQSELAPLSPEETEKQFPQVGKKSSFWCEEGYLIDTPAYLAALFEKLKSKGSILVQQKVEDFSSLQTFDKIILCMGSDSPFIPLQKLKGHLLEIEWPSHLSPLESPILGAGYIIPKGRTCIIGSTYERNFSSVAPDLEWAKRELLPQADRMINGLSQAKVLKVMAGVRASTHDHLPLIESIDSKTTLFTGLGSRGLLYHALYAKKLADGLI
jgi:glycine/D-amino acid oxidase-like deaminating enzyme